MNKKFSVILFLTAFVLCLYIVCANGKAVNVFNAYADDETLKCESRSVYFCEEKSGTVIYEKNALSHHPIASMCKIMTLLITFENIDSGNLSFDEEITVSENASSMGGSQVYLEENGKYKVEDLIKSIVVASANDSCVAIAERLCGSEDAFVNKMNEKAKELGMNDTVFTNCTGLPKGNQYSCAKDVSKMFSELIKHTDYFRFSQIWMDEITHPKGRITEISNTNKLIKFYSGCDAGKTGYTSEAGHCLTATACKNGLRLICVVISSPDSKTRFKETSSFFDFGFNNFANKIIVNEENVLDVSVNVKNGKEESVTVKPKESLYYFSRKGEKHAFDIVFTPNELNVAPIFTGDTLGKIEVYENGLCINSVDAVATKDVLKATYFDNVKKVIKNFALI